MTTLTTMLGMLPLVLATGEGSELRGALAVAVVGGLAAATLLTLFVVPVLYAATASGEVRRPAGDTVSGPEAG